MNVVIIHTEIGLTLILLSLRNNFSSLQAKTHMLLSYMQVGMGESWSQDMDNVISWNYIIVQTLSIF